MQEREFSRPLAVVAIVAGVVAAVVLPGAARAEVSIAGLQPDARPAGAPSVTTFARTPAAAKAATAGISKPFPPTLKFLADQGAWYTPFDRAGMPGRYDIRKRHRN